MESTTHLSDIDTGSDEPDDHALDAGRAGTRGPDTLAAIDPITVDGSSSSASDRGTDQVAPADEQARLHPGLTEFVGEIERREFDYELLAGAAVRVSIPAGDAVMGVVPVLDRVPVPIGVLAESRDGSSALVMRDGDDLFVVKRSPGMWEHFRSRGGPSAIFGSWRTGERTRFRMRHGALWKSIPEAVDLAESIGVGHLLPAETPPPPPQPAPEKPKRTRTPRSTTPRTTAPRATARPKSPVKEEPTPRICPKCFMQLPASGVCECG